MFDIHILGDIFAVLTEEIPFAVRAVVGSATKQGIVSFPTLADVSAEYVERLRVVVERFLRALGIRMRAVHDVVEFLIVYDYEIILVFFDKLDGS